MPSRFNSHHPIRAIQSITGAAFNALVSGPKGQHRANLANITELTPAEVKARQRAAFERLNLSVNGARYYVTSDPDRLDINQALISGNELARLQQWCEFKINQSRATGSLVGKELHIWDAARPLKPTPKPTVSYPGGTNASTPAPRLRNLGTD